MRFVLRICSAVLTHQAAGTRDFPNNNKRLGVDVVADCAYDWRMMPVGVRINLKMGLWRGRHSECTYSLLQVTFRQAA